MRTHTEPKLYVYKKNGQPSCEREWYVYARFRHPEDGWILKKDRGGINFYKTVKDRMKAGRELLLSWRDLIRNGYTPFNLTEQEKEVARAKDRPVIKVLRELLEIKRKSIKHRSYQSYKFSVDLFESYLKSTNQEKIKQFKQGNDFGDWLSATRGYKGKTFNDTVGFLRIIFNMAVAREIIDKSPLLQIKKQREKSGTHKAFNEDQKKILKEYLKKKDPELWVFVQFIYYCFIRPVELLRIKVADVNLQTSQIFIYPNDAKNGDQQAVEIPDVFIDDVRKLNLDQYPKNYFLFGKELVPGKKSVWRNRISERHSEILRHLNIPNEYTLYSWKHTGNCDCVRAGVSIYWLMRQNRHSSPEITMKYIRCLGMERNIEFRTKAPKL